MEGFFILLALVWFFVTFVLPIVAVSRLNKARNERDALKKQCSELEAKVFRLQQDSKSHAKKLDSILANVPVQSAAQQSIPDTNKTTTAEVSPLDAAQNKTTSVGQRVDTSADTMDSVVPSHDAAQMPFDATLNANTQDTSEKPSVNPLSGQTASQTSGHTSSGTVNALNTEQPSSVHRLERDDTSSTVQLDKVQLDKVQLDKVQLDNTQVHAKSQHQAQNKPPQTPPPLDQLADDAPREQAFSGADDKKNTEIPAISSAQVYKRQNGTKATHDVLEQDESSLSVVTSTWQSVKNWFMGGNLIVRLGVIVLLIGVVLLLRLASDYFETPVELRLGLVAAGGLVLTALGLKFTQKRRGYGLSLQGAGLAVIYLTIFTSFKVFHVLPSTLSFGLLACLAGLSAFFAVKQNALPLAMMAFGGAFLAPILTSDDSGNVVGLFSYYLVLNAAIAWIAHHRTWKLLNLLGVGVTFGLAYVWGAGVFSSSESEHVLPTVRWQLVLLIALHLGLYIFIALRYTQQLLAAQKQQKLASNVPAIDAGLLFGVPILGFGLLAGLLHTMPYVLAGASALLSGVYLLLGNFLVKQSKAYRLMTEGTLALGTCFLALVLPLALSAQWTAVGWSIQGAALVWLGVRMSRIWSLVFGLVLQGVSFFIWAVLAFDGDASGLKLAIVVIAIASMVSAYLLRVKTTSVVHDSKALKNTAANTEANIQANIEDTVKSSTEKHSSAALSDSLPSIGQANPTLVSYSVLMPACITVFIALCSVIFDMEMIRAALDEITAGAVVLFILLSIFYVLVRYVHWNEVATLARGVFVLFSVLICAQFLDLNAVWHHFHKGQVANAITLGVLTVVGFIGMGMLWFKQWGSLVTHPKQDTADAAMGIMHSTRADQFIWLLILTTLVMSMAVWCFGDTGELARAVAPCLLLLGLSRYVTQTNSTAVSQAMKTSADTRGVSPSEPNGWFNLSQVLKDTAYVIVPLLILWLMVMNYNQSGQYYGIPYIPIVSLLDVSMCIVVVYILAMLNMFLKQKVSFSSWFDDNKPMLLIAAGTVFFWMLSSMLIRTLHQYLHTPIWYEGAWQNDIVQTGLTLLWITLALVFTVLASKRAWREVWLAGIGLLGLVLVKLIAIDLSNSSALLRVVSFIVAGLFMLVIGYFAPLPPKKDDVDRNPKDKPTEK